MSDPLNMKGLNFVWRGGVFSEEIRKHLSTQMTKASIIASQDIKASMPGSGVSGGISGATKGQRRRAASGRKGLPPLVQTGRLRNSIGYSVPLELVRFIGANVGSGRAAKIGGKGYAYILEFLGHRKGWRPFLRPYFENNRAKMRKIILTPMPLKRLK